MCVCVFRNEQTCLSQHPKGLKDEEAVTVDEILKDEVLQAENNYVQVSELKFKKIM